MDIQEKNKTNSTIKEGKGFEMILKKKRVWLPLLIGVLVIVVAIVIIVIVLNLNRDGAKPVDNNTEYSITPNPETGEPPLFGNDPNKDNSGEAFVEFQERIIASPDYSIVTKNSARILIAVHYNAIGRYDVALEYLKQIDNSIVFGEQLVQLYQAFADAYNGLGEVELSNEYRTMAEQVEL